MEPPESATDAPDPRRRIESIVEHVAHLLPAQGPISIFVHHNTLHAFEHLPFEQAVVEAGRVFGCEPYLPEDRYREELARGRITDLDLDAILSDELGASSSVRVGSTATRVQIRRAMLRHPIARPRGAALEWILDETPVLRQFAATVPPDARREVVEGTRRSLEHGSPSPSEERAALSALWEECRRVAEEHPAPIAAPPAAERPRDLMLAAGGEDTDALVHPLMIRICAAFLDQGLAAWPMPERQRGLFAGFCRIYRSAGLRERWLAELPAELARLMASGADSAAVTEESLTLLGLEEARWEAAVRASILALRGWAGMIRQLETRPDRVPAIPVPASLVDFLAVRLLLDRLALAHVAREVFGWTGPLSELPAMLQERVTIPAPASPHERAFVLFQVAQTLGLSASLLSGLSAADARALLEEIDGFDEIERRRLFHLAYERRYREEVLDSLVLHTPRPPARFTNPKFQAIFCIDEREESIRRHLEEVEPLCETLGSAGFFGVAMYYRGAGDARPMPLCPVVIRPKNEVEEVVVEERRASAERRARARRVFGKTSHALTVSSRSFARGAVLSAVMGSLAALPLVMRVLFPRITARLQHGAASLFLEPPTETRLLLDERPDERAVLGEVMGYSVAEQAAIVRRLLEDAGLAGRLAPLVLVVGHGSSSLNNPHESAHDCGACGGGRGGPNARAFATMANDPRVRALLSEDGFPIPASARFVGAYHNSCDDSMTFYDTDSVVGEARLQLVSAQRSFEEARARNAHERCRRFANAALDLKSADALAHVETRVEDLAQTRPEYGHATNAACVVGRRDRTRGLFLDRRSFLVSYDPTTDDAQGTVLERVLSAIAPVCAGINLEYYFSYVDPHGYGCHTKLPHNISALLGVMDGHASDLRPGLPWQMVEIHEPVRLLLVVEASPATIAAVMQRSASFARLVNNRWIQLASLSPTEGPIRVYSARERSFVDHVPEARELPVVGSSLDWYGGRREHLRCARIVSGRKTTRLETLSRLDGAE